MPKFKYLPSSWWRHQMETFSALPAICTWNSPVPGEFPAQRPVTRSFDVFFDLRLNKWLSKQSWSWWFTTLWRPLWRHRNIQLICCILLHYACETLSWDILYRTVYVFVLFFIQTTYTFTCYLVHHCILIKYIQTSIIVLIYFCSIYMFVSL